MNAEVALKPETDDAQAHAYETTAVVLWFNPIKGYGFLQDDKTEEKLFVCLLYTSPSPRDATLSRMPSSA